MCGVARCVAMIGLETSRILRFEGHDCIRSFRPRPPSLLSFIHGRASACSDLAKPRARVPAYSRAQRDQPTADVYRLNSSRMKGSASLLAFRPCLCSDSMCVRDHMAWSRSHSPRDESSVCLLERTPDLELRSCFAARSEPLARLSFWCPIMLYARSMHCLALY